MSKTADDDLNRRLHEAEKVRLLRLPNFPPRPQDDEHGVLLSDRIEAYCRKYQLVSPFEKNQLRSASYALAVGRYYSIGGLRKSLAEGESLTIEPYQVAIIQTYETINMPPYLIGRWNVQVTKAYDGLLWVGGAQVDPGFRGYLCCPIYNLSAKKVTLHFRDKLAVIDFVTTTPYVEGKCLPYDWRNRKRLIFQDYPTLNSGIEHKVKKFEDSIRAEADKTKEKLAEAADGTQRSLQYINSRIDTFLTLVFTVVAVLFAGLGIVATTGREERSFLNPTVWIAAIALYFALRANCSSEEGVARPKWYTTRPLALSILAVLVVAGLSFRIWDAIGSERQAREVVIQELRDRSEAGFEHLQQQLNELRKQLE